MASGWPESRSMSALRSGSSRSIEIFSSRRIVSQYSQRSSPTRPPRSTLSRASPSHSSVLRLVIKTLLRPPLNRLSSVRRTSWSSLERFAVTDVPGMPRTDSKLSQTMRTRSAFKIATRRSSFVSIGSDMASVPINASTIRLTTYSALWIPWNTNQRHPLPRPPVSLSQRTNPRASVVLPTPPSPWINRPGRGRCIARSSSKIGPSRPTKPCGFSSSRASGGKGISSVFGRLARACAAKERSSGSC